MKLFAQFATLLALVARFILVAIGFYVVPFTGQTNPVWGNDEEAVPDWYEPDWKISVYALLTAGAMWFVLTGSWLYAAVAAGYAAFWATWPERRDYLWRAFRNPANNIRYRFTQPEQTNIRGHHNPEKSVRNRMVRRATRQQWAGPYYEYWRVWRTKDNLIAELRIGWKFSPVPGFAPTLQFRKGV